MAGPQFNAPLAYYGQMVLDRDIYPYGVRGDIWYHADLQLKVIDNMLGRGRIKLQGDLTAIAQEMEECPGTNRFDEIGAEGSVLFLFVSPLFCNTIMAQTYSILEIALTELCETYNDRWLDLYKEKRRWSIIGKAKHFLLGKGLKIENDHWIEIDLWRKVRNDIIHNVGRAEESNLIKYREKLEIAVEVSQGRIMLDPNKCIDYINLVNRFINGIFKQVSII